MNFYCSYNREHLCMAKSLQETREIFSICQKFQSQRVYTDTSLYSNLNAMSDSPSLKWTTPQSVISTSFKLILDLTLRTSVTRLKSQMTSPTLMKCT